MAAQKARRRPIEPLTPAEVSRLLAACSQRAPTGVRNRALLVIMYRGGLRVAEALALKASDINAAAGTVRILDGKGAKARTVAIDEGAIAVIQRWADTRRTLAIPGRFLFCTLAGRSATSMSGR